MSADALLPPQENSAGTVTLARDGSSGAELKQIALSFLRLGTTAFGGPAAHIAMMEEEFVRRRGWVSYADFLDMLGASNLIPGPSSTEMAIHIGHQRAGWRGLPVAGVCFILPAMLIVVACAWAYATFGSLPQVQSVLYGVKPVIIAVVLRALWRLGRNEIKNGFLLAVGLLGTAAGIAGGNVLAILLGAGLVTVLPSVDQGAPSLQQSPRTPGSCQIPNRGNSGLGRHGPDKLVRALPGFSEIWRRHLRKRLCTVGVSSG